MQAQLLYSYWFTQYNFPLDHSNCKRKKQYNNLLQKEIPIGWQVNKLSECSKIISGGTPSTNHVEYYCNDGYAWITPNDLSKNRNNYFISHGERDITIDGIKNSSAQIIPENSILLSTRAPIGYIAISISEVTTNQGFKSIVPYDERYLYYLFFTIKRDVPLMERLGSGTTFKEVSKDSIEKFSILMPPISLIDKFDSMVIPIMNRIKQNEIENRYLFHIRDWLLPMLMNGQATIDD